MVDLNTKFIQICTLKRMFSDSFCSWTSTERVMEHTCIDICYFL